jgi:choline-sulfatase
MERSIAQDEAPFFACTTLMETHEPHLAPEREGRDLLTTSNIVLQPGLVRLVRMHAHNWGSWKLSPRLIERWRAGYEREIAYVDGWLGRLREMLADQGRAEDTVIVVTADHGETFGEGGTVGHGLSLREGLARVPLIVSGPDVDTSVVQLPVSLTRVAATVLDLLVEPTEGSLLSDNDGKAVMEVERPSHVAHPSPRSQRVERGPGAAFYDGPLKLVVDPFDPADAPPRLYDLDDDPDETRDLWGQRDPTPAQSAALEAWRERAEGLPS